MPKQDYSGLRALRDALTGRRAGRTGVVKDRREGEVVDAKTIRNISANSDGARAQDNLRAANPDLTRRRLLAGAGALVVAAGAGYVFWPDGSRKTSKDLVDELPDSTGKQFLKKFLDPKSNSMTVAQRSEAFINEGNLTFSDEFKNRIASVERMKPSQIEKLANDLTILVAATKTINDADLKNKLNESLTLDPDLSNELGMMRVAIDSTGATKEDYFSRPGDNNDAMAMLFGETFDSASKSVGIDINRLIDPLSRSIGE